MFKIKKFSYAIIIICYYLTAKLSPFLVERKIFAVKKNYCHKNIFFPLQNYFSNKKHDSVKIVSKQYRQIEKKS